MYLIAESTVANYFVIRGIMHASYMTCMNSMIPHRPRSLTAEIFMMQMRDIECLIFGND